MSTKISKLVTCIDPLRTTLSSNDSPAGRLLMFVSFNNELFAVQVKQTNLSLSVSPKVSKLVIRFGPCSSTLLFTDVMISSVLPPRRLMWTSPRPITTTKPSLSISPEISELVEKFGPFYRGYTNESPSIMKVPFFLCNYQIELLCIETNV